MRLTAFTDYGLRTLMRLAGNYLTKVVQDLARAGYIRTQRGAGGALRPCQGGRRP